MYRYIVLISLFLSVQSEAASFDCQKASSNVEKIICSEKSASDADENFSKTYSQTYGQATADEKVILKKEQIVWLTQVRNKCIDAECIKSAYNVRLGELKKYHHDPERHEIEIDRRNVFVLKLSNSNSRTESFTRSGGSLVNGKIDNCEMLIDLPVGTAQGNHSYGAYCYRVKPSGMERVMVCDDDLVGHFTIEVVQDFGDIGVLAKFVNSNCVGG